MTHNWGYVGAIASAIFFGMTATLNKIVLEDACMQGLRLPITNESLPILVRFLTRHIHAEM